MQLFTVKPHHLNFVWMDGECARRYSMWFVHLQLYCITISIVWQWFSSEASRPNLFGWMMMLIVRFKWRHIRQLVIMFGFCQIYKNKRQLVENSLKSVDKSPNELIWTKLDKIGRWIGLFDKVLTLDMTGFLDKLQFLIKKVEKFCKVVRENFFYEIETLIFKV